MRLVLQAQRRRSVTGVAGLVGARGVADTEMEPEGWVLVMGERWRGVADAPVRRRRGGAGDVGGRPARAREEGGGGSMSSGMTVIGIFVVFWLLLSLKVLNEYERGVIFRLGKLLPQAQGPRASCWWSGPSTAWCASACARWCMDVPPQDVITRDNVSVKVNAVVYFRVVDPVQAVVQVENYLYATSQMAQTTLRSILGRAHLDELLSERERLAQCCRR